MPMQKNWESDGTDSNSKGLSRPRKNAVIFLASAAVFIVVFWVWQMSAHINKPFDYNLSPKNITSENDYDDLLKKTDTDKDGLSDYDEIYTYKTSPYLEDTDSDGISDKKETDNGTNPVCPQGKVCGTPIDTTEATTINSETPANSNPLSDLNSISADETALQAALNGQSDAATLRQLLISSGASAEDLNKISDEDLMKSYQETLESQSQ